MQKFNSTEEYKNWIESQDWYQTIELKNDLITPGKCPTNTRADFFDKFDFKNKSVLDIGCNSGQYSFFAKRLGASDVLGIDILSKRITQAKTIALNEGYDVRFEERGIFDLVEQDGVFDIVFCIAVITEVSDLFGAIKKIKNATGQFAIIELDIAKPLIYLSTSKNWLRGIEGVPKQKSVAEIRHSKSGGWVISPTFEVLESAFGNEFKLERLGEGVRYDLIKVTRVSN